MICHFRLYILCCFENTHYTYIHFEYNCKHIEIILLREIFFFCATAVLFSILNLIIAAVYISNGGKYECIYTRVV